MERGELDRGGPAVRAGTLTRRPAVLEVPEPLRLAWGLRLSSRGLEVGPDLSGGDPPALVRARCGRTLVDLAIRRRPGQVVVRCARRFGPPLPLRLAPVGLEASQATVDELPVGASQVSLLLEREHEIVYYL